MRIARAIALAGCLVLAGCGRNAAPLLDVSSSPPRIDAPDASLMQDCTWPLAVAKVMALPQEKAETLLKANAINQIDCWNRHHSLVTFIRNRDAALTAPVQPKQ